MENSLNTKIALEAALLTMGHYEKENKEIYNVIKYVIQTEEENIQEIKIDGDGNTYAHGFSEGIVYALISVGYMLEGKHEDAWN